MIDNRWITRFLRVLAHYSDYDMRVYLQDFYTAAQARFGTNSSFTGLGDMIGAFGPFGLAAVSFLLLALIFAIACRKSKKKAGNALGLICAFIAMMGGAAWFLLWIRPARTWFMNTGFIALSVISGIVFLFSLILFCVLTARLARAGKGSESAETELERLKQENARLKAQMAGLQQGGAQEAPPSDRVPEEPIVPSPAAARNGFFARRCVYVLLAAILGLLACFAYRMIVNGRINTANTYISASNSAESIESSVQSSTTGIVTALSGVALLPAMLVSLASALFCLIGYLFRQRWAALVGGIGFSLALLFGLSCFYVPILPMTFAFIGFSKMKNMGGSQAPSPAAASGKGGGRKAAVILLILLVILGAGGYAAAKYYFIPKNTYENAVSAFENRNYQRAIALFTELGDYKDSKARLAEAEKGRDYEQAQYYLTAGKYDKAAELFTALGDWGDSAAQLATARQRQQEALRRAELNEIKQTDKIYTFSHGLAVYRSKSGKYGVIDTEGRIIVKAAYSSADIIEDGYIVVRAGDTYDTYGLLDPGGNTVLPCEYSAIYPTGSDGLWSVKKKDDSLALVNAQGQEICAGFNYHISFSEGLACVQEDAGARYIDEAGNTVISINGAVSGSKFKNGVARVVIQSASQQTYARIDKQGNTLSSFVWDARYRYPEYDAESDRYIAEIKGGGLASIDAKTGQATESWWLDTANKKKAPLHTNDNVRTVSEGKIAVMMYETEKIDAVLRRYTQTMCYLDADTMGLIIFPSSDRWSEAKDFKDGYAIVRTCGTNQTAANLGMLDYSKNGLYGIINSKGNYAVKPKYDAIYNLTGSYFRVKTNGKWGVINAKTGAFVINPTADEISALSDGLIRVKVSGYYGYLDASFKKAIEIKYEDATSFDPSSHLALVKSGGKWKAIDRNGNTVW